MRHFKNIRNLKEHYGVDSKHPLIDVQKYEEANSESLIRNEAISFDFHTISFVKNFNGFIQIGQTKLEGENGVLHFIEPQQLYTCNATNPWEGYQVLIHSQIFEEHFTHKEIESYDFFSYEVNESLLLTREEKESVENLLSMAWKEFGKPNDDYSIPIVLSYLSTLLNLTDRFYARQFETRKTLNNQLTADFFALLNSYYSQNVDQEVYQPTVKYFADKLNITPNYLSDTVRYHSGNSTLTLIHDLVMEEAKKQIRFSNKTLAEISHQLGFEYPNYFSRLFKKKTGQTPSEYRKSVKSI